MDGGGPHRPGLSRWFRPTLPDVGVRAADVGVRAADVGVRTVRSVIGPALSSKARTWGCGAESDVPRLKRVPVPRAGLEALGAAGVGPALAPRRRRAPVQLLSTPPASSPRAKGRPVPAPSPPLREWCPA